eukprot:26390_1
MLIMITMVQHLTDAKLVTIHAANLGFQSKINSVQGSYMIYGFVSKMLNALQDNDGKLKSNQFLYEVFDEIQEELGAEKQLPIMMYNNGTRYIKFVENKIDLNNDNDEVELMQVEPQTNEEQYDGQNQVMSSSENDGQNQ